MARKNTEVIADETTVTDNQLQQNEVESRIITIRGVEVILDKDLASFYHVTTKRLNEQVRRNKDRFPSEFMFQLTKEEWDNLRSQNATINGRGQHSKYRPRVYTEYGVIMVAAVLKSKIADDASIMIVKAFVEMRRFLATNGQIFQRLDRIEYKLMETDIRFEELYSKLDEKTITPKQGIFFDGQVFDAYDFICSLIKNAKQRINLIDNYIDETVLTMLDKRDDGVSASIYTNHISQQLQLDLTKHNAQYAPILIKPFNKAHDRFLILDNKVYHIGASLKDLGKKWFAFSLMNDLSPEELLSKL